MKIIKYSIRNYKAISNTEITLRYSINPIIGVNESGKTTILHAILAFDKNRDKVNSGSHLDFQNKYFTKDTKESKISAHLKLNKHELSQLKEYLSLKTGTPEYKEVLSFTENTEFIFTRELSADDKPYTIENISFPEKTTSKFKKFLQKRLPFILYFDDFTDRVPDNISFKEDYKTTGKLAYSKNREWQEILVEIFRRAEVDGIDDEASPLKSFFNLSDEDRKDDILSDIQGVLNKEIIDEWKRIKKSGHKNFADDSEHLSIELKCKEQTFTFKVKDKSNQDKKRTFNVGERSKGFQWFFNYMIKLKFNPRYKGTQENSIFLLDEPGSYLHSSAQSELLAELKSVSNKNTIVYCTHSQYLLNPKTIKLGSIKIAEKESSVINLTNYGSYKGKDDKGALSAVYQALNLNFMQEFVGKIVITEGVTDFYFLEMLKVHTSHLDKEFKVIPGAGSGNLSNLISIGLSFSENFVVLFDNDKGAKAIKKYESEFGEDIARHFHLYSTKKGFALEDFMSKSEKSNLREITKTKDLKKAMTLLYYDIEPKRQKAFFSGFSNETLHGLSATLNRIANL